MRRLLALGLLAVIALAPAPARADDILESGPCYFVIAHHPNAGGAAILDVEMSPFAPYDLTTTIVDIWAAPGWTYRIYDDGGVNSPVDIRYESTWYKSKFTELYKPGKTVIDYGEIKPTPKVTAGPTSP